jgi:hypothetical protein
MAGLENIRKGRGVEDPALLVAAYARKRPRLRESPASLTYHLRVDEAGYAAEVACASIRPCTQAIASLISGSRMYSASA